MVLEMKKYHGPEVMVNLKGEKVMKVVLLQLEQASSWQ